MLDRGMRPVLGRRVTPPVGEGGFDCAACDVGEQSGAAVQRRNRNRGVDRAFVAAARLTVQAQPPLST